MNAVRTAKAEVKNAVAALGYKNAEIEIATASYHRLIVFVNNARFGIYDMDKHTFVD